MARINDNYLKLKAGYLFPEIGRRVRAFQKEHPEAKIIRLGIGDVTEPLPPACIAAMHKAVDDMGRRETFRGYMDDSQGYDWLREAIAGHDFRARGCDVIAGEIFVSEGAKSDTANILDIFTRGENRLAVTDPVYPVYVDSNVMAGNTGPANDRGEYAGITYLSVTAENNFTPALPASPVDIIYLCYPNNPTGTVLPKAELKKWVDFAREHNSVIFYDAAYEAYITDPEIPHSIYEIDGARDVAIEFRSFSKTAGFTGTRCAYTVIPESLTGRTAAGSAVGPPAQHEVQRRLVHHPARGRSGVQPRRQGPGAAAHRLLPHQREAAPRGPAEGGHFGIRRCQRPVHLAEDPRRQEELGVLRRTADESPPRRHARQRLRRQRRRLLPPERLQQPRKRGAGGGAVSEARELTPQFGVGGGKIKN